MKPDWDKLMAEFADSPTALVADVDCTEAGKSLCEKFGVSGYPTIKHGEPGDMKDYEGGRSFDDFKKFATESLGPSCGPGEHIDLCDAATKEKIVKYELMSVEKLEGKVRKAVKDVEVEMPIMKKVIGHKRAQEGKTADGSAEL